MAGRAPSKIYFRRRRVFIPILKTVYCFSIHVVTPTKQSVNTTVLSTWIFTFWKFCQAYTSLWPHVLCFVFQPSCAIPPKQTDVWTYFKEAWCAVCICWWGVTSQSEWHILIYSIILALWICLCVCAVSEVCVTFC